MVFERHNGILSNKSNFLFLLVLLLYIFLRIIVWQDTTQFEDHDSIGYLGQADVVRSLNWDDLVELGPDFTPFYPTSIALFSTITGSLESGGRLSSLFFSVLLFIAVIGIGKRFASDGALLVALLIMTFNTVLMRLSIGIVSEPSYIAVVYCGFYFFWVQFDQPTYKKGFFAGLLFSFAFLNRTEGLLFVVVFPLLQCVHYFFYKKKYDSIKLGYWAFFFVIGFSLLSSIQIFSVAKKAGSFAINGRQIWGIILNNPDGKSYEEKIYGLDYSEKELNIEYLQKNPEAVQKMVQKDSTGSLMTLVKKIGINITELYQLQMGILIGPLGHVLFGLGLLSLIQKNQYRALFLIIAFIGMNLVAPILWDVEMRHILVIAPLIILVEGIGTIYFSQEILKCFRSLPEKYGKYLKVGIPSFFVLATLGFTAIPVGLTLKSPKELYYRQRTSLFLGNPYNYEYDPLAYKTPLLIMQKEKEKQGGKKLSIASRKMYFPFMANAKGVLLPYTDYAGLIRYCQLNDIEYLFLDYQNSGDRPFIKSLYDKETPDFQLLHSNNKKGRKRIELYRISVPAQ